MRKITYSQAINEALTDMMSKNSTIVYIDELAQSGGDYGISNGLAQKFGEERVLEIAAAENSTVGVALGLAMTGAKPVVSIKKGYFLKNLNTIVNEIATMEFMQNSQYNSSMVIRIEVGHELGLNPQLNQDFESILAHIPGVDVVYPSNAYEAKGLMISALSSDRPVIFLENINLYNVECDVPEDAYEIRIGEAKVLLTGSDVTVISYGSMIEKCVVAIFKAAEKSVKCELINLMSISPIDSMKIIESVSKTGKAVIVHEDKKTMGLGAEIAAIITCGDSFDYLEAPIERVCGKDQYIGYASEYLEECVPSADDIFASIMHLVNPEN